MASEEERVLNELKQVKQSFKDNFESDNISTQDVEFRNMPQLLKQMEKILPSQTKTITPTKSQQNVSADEGYKLTSVKVGAIPDNYIEPTGTLPVTENGIKDVTQYKSIDVNVEGIKPTGTLNITKNDTYDVTNYASAEVNVPSEEPVLQEKTATPTKETQEITPDEGYDGIDKMTINPIPEEYIIPEGTLEIKTNGKHDVTEVKEVDVNVLNSGDLILVEREINNANLDLSSGYAVIQPSYTKGGKLDLIKQVVDGSISADVDNNRLVLYGKLHSTTYGKVKFYAEKDGELIVKCTFGRYYEGYSTSIGCLIGNLDTDINGVDYNNYSGKADFYYIGYYDDSDSVMTKRIPVTKGEHFIMFGSPASYSKTGATIYVNEMSISPEEVINGDALTKIVIEKPTDLNEKSILEGNKVFGIVGKAFGAGAVIAGTGASFEDDSVTKVKPYAFFQDSVVTSVNFPNCSSVGGSAFYSCSNLSYISMPEVTIIGEQAFRQCGKLTTLDFPKCSQVYGSAFSGCGDTEVFNFPELTTIWYDAFRGCGKYISSFSFNMPKVTTIYGSAFMAFGDSRYSIDFPELVACSSVAFSNCYNSGITAPKLTTLTGSSVFYACPYITKIDFPLLSSASGTGHFANCTKLSEARLPLLSSIAGNMFMSCSSLEVLDMPEATYIGAGAFTSCSKLSSVYFPKVTSTSMSAFQSCSALTTVSFPEATVIGNSTFLGCSQLTSVSLPKVSSIGTNAFGGCSALTEMYLPEVTSLGSYVFNDCINLSYISVHKLPFVSQYAFQRAGITSITLPNVSYVSGSAFQSCSYLSYIDLPVCTKLSYYYIFSGCTSLETLIIRTSDCTMQQYQAFTNSPMSNSSYLGKFGSIYVPADYVDSYKTRTNWTYYSDRITSIDNLPTT